VSALTISGVANGTSTNSSEGYVSDSTTAATFAVSGLLDAAGVSDTITVAFVQKSGPVTANAFMYFVDSSTSGLTLVDSLTSVVAPYASGTAIIPVRSALDTSTGVSSASGQQMRLVRAAAGYVGGNFDIQLDSFSARAAGTYVYTVIAKGYSGTAAVQTVTADVSIVVPKAVNAATTPSAATSFAVLTRGAVVTTPQVDSAVVAVATAGTVAGFLSVGVRNSSNATGVAQDSVTATIAGAGLLCNPTASGTCGKSFKLASTGDATFTVVADGTAGVGTINVSTTVATYAAKSVTFYSATPSTSVASVAKPVLEANSTSEKDVVRATINDANGNRWSGDAYIYATSAASALIAGSETPALCEFDIADNRHECPVSGKAVGSATFKVIDASTVAASKLASNEVTVRVATATPASFTLVFDKATYAPGEKAVLSVVPVDAAGARLPGKTYDNLLASGGITSTIAFSTGSDTLTATAVVVSASSSSTSGTTAGQRNYTVYMPFASGPVVVTATGGVGVAVAGRVAVSATAEVVNSSVDAATDAANEATDAANAATDAALAAADAADAATAAAEDASAAVATLAASVNTALGNLKKQITALTALVNKLLKKK
jgi:hypothetical protein